MISRLQGYLGRIGARLSQPRQRRILRNLTALFLIAAAYGLWQGSQDLPSGRGLVVSEIQGQGEQSRVVELASRISSTALAGGAPGLNATQGGDVRTELLSQAQTVARVAPLPEILDLSQVVWPVTGGIEGDYGWYRDPLSMDWRFRGGILIKPDRDPAPVRASLPGEVISIGTSGTGYHVMIAHAEGWRTEYIGLESVSVTVGSRVEAGDTIGTFRAAPHREALYYIVRDPNGTADPTTILYPRTIGGIG